jgi:2-keto-4-pentenoate hydratase
MTGDVTLPPATGYALSEIAEELYRAETSRVPVEPLTARYPGLSVADAYRIQQLNIARREAAGERVSGHKIGLTARAMQIKFNVDEPDYGHLLDTMRVRLGAVLDMAELIDPQIEVEPAFLLGKPLAGPGVTLEDVMAATEYVCVCFEVIDSRIADWRIRLEDTVADNGSSARLVLGAEQHDPAGLDLYDRLTELEMDGRVVERGSTRAILGHPANGIAWLANALARFEVALEAGHIVLPGTCTRSRRIAGCSEVRGRIEGLGEVHLALDGAPFIARPTD